MKPFAELLDRLLYTPQRNVKLALHPRLFPHRARSRPRLGAGGADRRLELRPRQAGADPRAGRPTRTDPVLFGWSYDFVGDLAETAALIWPEPEAERPWPRLDEVVAALETDAQGRAAATGRRLARHARRHRPLGAAQAGHRRAARRRLGPARQAGAGRVWRPGAGRDRGGLARARAALRRPVRLARRPRAAARGRGRRRCSGR